jgi:hypothetical protein
MVVSNRATKGLSPSSHPVRTGVPSGVIKPSHNDDDGYVAGFRADAPAAVMRDIRIIQNELY